MLIIEVAKEHVLQTVRAVEDTGDDPFTRLLQGIKG